MQLRFLLALLLLTLVRPLVAQTGSIDPTEEQLTGVRVMATPEIELVEEKVVDLRRWMPKVGTQSMNDCTAWAVGYGAKTYLEARDQGWKPDAPQRIFSPAFLYNQMNGGKDGGSNFYRMIQFMQKNGAATLASSPYRSRDFKTQPTDRAKAEAKAFPVLDLVLLKNTKSIRRALQRRQVVVFGAHVNPIFLSGRFKTYTGSLFVQDCKLRKPNQQHGKHAMVIVGYDDNIGCFLIQNSWGENWNQRGYAFVQYELFDKVEIRDDDAVFCNWACTIEDIEEPIEIGSDGIARPKPLNRDTLKISGYSDISRYDEELEKYVYVFTADLRGPKALLEQVEKVTWTWKDDKEKKQSFTNDLALMRFAALGGTTQNPLALEGLIHFKDGSTRKVEQEIVGPNPKADFREAEIIFKDSYYGPGAGGRADFWWEASLDFPLEQRKDIVKVKWDLGENMNRRDPVQINTGRNGRPGEEIAIGMCQTPSRISAEIHYIDGGIKTVSLLPRLTDEVNENFRIEVDKRQMGVDPQGRPLYSFTLTIDYPRRKLFDVERVDWKLDAIFDEPESWSIATLDSFPTHGVTDHDFRAIATLKMKDGSTKTLESWVTFSPETAYPDADRVELIGWNNYFGRESGEPQYECALRLIGDRRQTERIKKVFIQEETGSDNEEYDVVKDDNHPTWYWSASGGERAIVNVRIVFDDGREKKIRYVHERKLKPNDVLGFRVDMEAKPETQLNFNNQETHQFSVRPIGPFEDTSRIIAIDWYHTPADRREKSSHGINRVGFFEGHQFTSVLTKPFELEARLHYHTGFEENLRVSLSPITTGDLRPSLGIRAMEKFWGYKEGKPWWFLELRIARNEYEYAAPVKKVVYTLQSIDRDKAYNPLESTDPDGTFTILIDRPTRVKAEIEFTDGRKRTLETFVSAKAKRHPEMIHLRNIYNNYKWPFSGNKFLLVVDAWQGERNNIVGVDFKADVEYFNKTHDFTDGVPGLITYSRIAPEPETMGVVVKKKDGTSKSFEVKLGEPIKKVNWTYRTTYWGNGHWQIDAWAIGDWWHLKDLGKSLVVGAWDQDTLKFADVGSWPLNHRRAFGKAGQHKVSPGRSNQGALPGLDLALGQDGKTRSEELQLSVTPSPFKHELATVPEWIIAVVGPERYMERVVSVDYVYEDDQPRAAHVTQRWGEFYACFEHRAYGAKPPAVKATVKLSSGTSYELSFTSK